MDINDLFDKMFLSDDVLGMKGSYEERKVDNTVVDGLTIDTAAVTDAPHPYETAVRHEEFYDKVWSVVEEYDTKEEAKIGHEKWVKFFQKGLPDFIEDVTTCPDGVRLRNEEGKIIHNKN